MDIHGISAFYHDAAAALIRDGIPIAAVQEERFTRKKNDPSFPSRAIRYCLREGQITAHVLPEHLQEPCFYGLEIDCG